jgi:hypothetical protein
MKIVWKFKLLETLGTSGKRSIYFKPKINFNGALLLILKSKIFIIANNFYQCELKSQALETLFFFNNKGSFAEIRSAIEATSRRSAING